jgi:hypothetical protein
MHVEFKFPVDTTTKLSIRPNMRITIVTGTNARN